METSTHEGGTPAPDDYQGRHRKADASPIPIPIPIPSPATRTANRRRRLPRELKIALLSAAATLVAAVVASPWPLNLWHARFGSGGPGATIISPSGGPVPAGDFAVAGTAKDIPANDDLWIFVQPANDTGWYPAPNDVTVTNGTWNLPAGKLCMTDTAKAEVWVVAVPDDNTAAVNNYLKNAGKLGKNGLSALPPGSDRLASVTVTFPRKASCG